MKRKILSLFFFSFILMIGIPPTSWAGMEGAVRAKLENGLEIIFVENHASPVVVSNIFIRAGEVTEPPHMGGAAHFLEHLLFNGTERRSQKELYDEVDFLGAYNNAFTREDYTCFQMIISSSLLNEGLDIQSDMLLHSTMPEDKFEKEKNIVIEEMGRERGSPDYRAELLFIEKAYAGTAYARPILGTAESVKNMKRDDVYRYYKEYYIPNNMILFLVGDFKAEDALRSITKYFGTVPRSKLTKMPEVRFTLERDKNLFRNRIDAGRNYLDIITGAPGLKSPDFVPFQVLVSILSDGEDSKLSRSLKRKEAPLVLDFSLDHTIRGGEGLLHFSATIPPDIAAEKVAEAYLLELQKVAQEGIDPDDIDESKKDLKASEIYQQEQFHTYPVMRGEWISLTHKGFVENYLTLLGEQDTRSISAIATKYLNDLSPVIVLSGPTQPEAASEHFTVPKYAKEAKPAAPEVTKREILSNGLTVIARRDSSSRIFALHLLMKNRAMNEPDGKAGIADFTHRMLLKGAEYMTAPDISEALKELGARVKLVDDPSIPYDDYYTTPLYSYIRFEVLSEDYKKGLKLLKEIVFHPSFPEGEISGVRAELEDTIKKNEEKVSVRAKNLFYSKVFEGSALGNPVCGDLASIRSITREDLVSFHARYFSPGNIIASVVSEIPSEIIVRELEEIFGDLKPSAEPIAAFPTVEPTVKAEKFEIKGGREQAYIYEGYIFRPEGDDLPALTAANAILSERMAFTMREKLGLAYSIGSSLTSYGGLLLFMASIGTRPENIERALNGINSEVSSLSGSEISGRDLQRTINSFIGRNVMRRISGINRAYFMGLSEFMGNGTDFDLDMIEKMKKVTLEGVKQAAGKYLHTSDAILVIAQ